MGLKGSLAELPLADLIEMTSLGGKSGRLTLFDEGGAMAGELAFRDGRLVGVLCGELGAEKAFYALLALKNGAFDFDPAAELDDESCNLPIESLLLEGMRRLDELRRLRSDLPAPARVRLLGGGAEDELEARAASCAWRPLTPWPSRPRASHLNLNLNVDIRSGTICTPDLTHAEEMRHGRYRRPRLAIRRRPARSDHRA